MLTVPLDLKFTHTHVQKATALNIHSNAPTLPSSLLMLTRFFQCTHYKSSGSTQKATAHNIHGNADNHIQYACNVMLVLACDFCS